MCIIIFIVDLSYASVNSSSAHAPPPRANPRALAFFLEKWANSRGWGHMSCLNAPGKGRRKKANARTPRSSPSNTSAVVILIGEFLVL